MTNGSAFNSENGSRSVNLQRRRCSLSVRRSARSTDSVCQSCGYGCTRSMGSRDPLRNDGSRKRPGFCGAGLGPQSSGQPRLVAVILCVKVCRSHGPTSCCCDAAPLRRNHMRSPPRLPRWTSIALAGLMCTPTLACSDADGRAYQGTIATAILPDDASRSMVIVQLDGNDSGDSNRVRITFPTTELSCRDGSEVNRRPLQLAPKSSSYVLEMTPIQPFRSR